MVRPFLTAEAGSCLFHGDRLVGFVVPHGKAPKAWSLFEAGGTRLAVVSRDEAGFAVRVTGLQAGAEPSLRVASLSAAARQVIGVEEYLEADPAVPGWTVVKETPRPEASAIPPTRKFARKPVPVAPRTESKGPVPQLVFKPVAPKPVAVVRPPQAVAKPAAPAKDTKKLSKELETQTKRTLPLAQALVVLGLVGYLSYALWALVSTYTS